MSPPGNTKPDDRALAFVGQARSLLESAPPAFGLDVFLYVGGCSVLLQSPTEEGVETLATEFGLGPVEERRMDGRRWMRARSERYGVSFEVTGPPRYVTPEPGSNGQPFSSSGSGGTVGNGGKS